MNIIWKAQNIETIRQVNEFKDVVDKINWIAYIENNKEKNMQGSVNLNFDTQTTTFIPFNSLTDQTVVTWIKDSLNSNKVADIENKLLNS